MNEPDHIRQQQDDYSSQNTTVNKTPPQNIELEMCVLGAIMLEPAYAYEVAATILSPDSFYLDGHAAIFNLMGELHAKGMPPDQKIVLDELRSRDLLTKIGGAGVLLDMINSVASAASVEYHAQKIADKATLRATIRHCTQTIEECYRQEYEPSQVLSELSGGADMLSGDTSHTADVQTFEQARDDYADDLIDQATNPHATTTTGMKFMDTDTGGYQPGDFWVLAAKTGSGKSRLSVYSAIKTAMDGHGAGYISLDMGKRRFMKYAAVTAMALGGCEHPWRELQPVSAPDGGLVLGTHFNQLNLGGKLLVATDMRNTSIRSIEAIIRHMVKAGCKVIFVDQAQNVAEWAGDRTTKISVVWGMAQAARRHQVALVLNHQISRAGYDRPKLEHLFETAAMEQHADFVMFIHDVQTAIFNENNGCYVEDPAGEYRAPISGDVPGIIQRAITVRRRVEIVLAKNRNDKAGITPVWFDYSTGVAG